MPSARAAAVVRSMNLSDADRARQNRELIAQAKTDLRSREAKRRSKVSLALVPPSLALHKGSEDATDERLMQAHAAGEIISKLGQARHLANPFASLAKRRSLNPGTSKADTDLNEALFAAGQKYAKASEGAHIGVLRSAGFTPMVARSTSPDIDTHGDRAVACRKIVDEVRDIIGPRLIGLVDAIVIEGRTLESQLDTYGRAKSRSHKYIEVRSMLVDALHQLVRHWRMYDYRAIGEAA